MGVLWLMILHAYIAGMANIGNCTARKCLTESFLEYAKYVPTVVCHLILSECPVYALLLNVNSCWSPNLSLHLS